MAFIDARSLPDGSEIATGQNFDKTWRLQNTGTCSWNTNYQVVFVDGDKLSAPSTKNLGLQVNPGETADFVVPMKAPDAAGTYKGYWKVKDDQGNYFVHNLWVEIKAKAGSAVFEIAPLHALPLLQMKVDESLIGGAVVRVGDHVYDGSVRTQLQRIGKQIVRKKMGGALTA